MRKRVESRRWSLPPTARRTASGLVFIKEKEKSCAMSSLSILTTLTKHTGYSTTEKKTIAVHELSIMITTISRFPIWPNSFCKTTKLNHKLNELRNGQVLGVRVSRA